MTKPHDLKGKRVLVLGGETALGRALAVGLAEAGADVAIASLSPGPEAEFAINSALNELWAMGRGGLALAIDASDEAQLREAVERVERELGRLDGAVVVADEPLALTCEALRAALSDRPMLVLDPHATPADALRAVSERL